MTTYPIPTGPGVPVVSDVTVEKAKSFGWLVKGTVRHTDGEVRYFAGFVETQGDLQKPELWAKWLDNMHADYSKE